MKRVEALADFSRDHLPALRQAKYLREAGTKDGDHTPEEAAENFLEFWDEEADLHFLEEEQVILPVLSRLGPITEDENVRRMLDDHAWFRDRIEDLRRTLDRGGDVEQLTHSIGERLKNHAEMEEQEIFEDLQDRLNDRQLEAIHRRSKTFREKWRPDSIGPRQPSD